jgi:hypothetical protein
MECNTCCMKNENTFSILIVNMVGCLEGLYLGNLYLLTYTDFDEIRHAKIKRAQNPLGKF